MRGGRNKDKKLARMEEEEEAEEEEEEEEEEEDRKRKRKNSIPRRRQMGRQRWMKTEAGEVRVQIAHR